MTYGQQVYMDWNLVPEKEVIHGVYDYFHYRGGYCWRNNTGAVKVAASDGRPARYIQYSEKGAADLIGVHSGFFFALETKSMKGKQSPEQLAWMETIREHGGIYILCRPNDYIEQIDAELRRLGLLMEEPR
jgi:penicillin-binding protein-related factor A (putative recombinase)